MRSNGKPNAEEKAESQRMRHMRQEPPQALEGSFEKDVDVCGRMLLGHVRFMMFPKGEHIPERDAPLAIRFWVGGIGRDLCDPQTRSAVLNWVLRLAAMCAIP